MNDPTIIRGLIALGYETTKAWKLPKSLATLVEKSRCAVCGCSMIETRGIGTAIGHRTYRARHGFDGKIVDDVYVDTCLSHYCIGRAVMMAEEELRARPEAAWANRQ